MLLQPNLKFDKQFIYELTFLNIHKILLCKESVGEEKKCSFLNPHTQLHISYFFAEKM